MNSVFFLLVLCASVASSSNSNLLSIVVIARHGDRTPTEFAPLDPYKDAKFWPAERGELTNKGILREYHLGKWLRQRYADYLSPKYMKHDIYVRSASMDRCLMSAASSMAGLYPPTEDQIWNPKLHWRPVPIHSRPMQEDTLLEMAVSCPRFEEMYQDLLQTEDFKRIDTLNSNLYSYLSKNLGVKIESFTDIEPWYDTLRVEALNNLTLPNWTQPVYQEMKKWSKLSFQVPTYNQDMARFATGPFFNMLSNHFLAVSSDSTEDLLAKNLFFTGHQTNICDITNTLEHFRSAPYASALIFELRNNTKSSKAFVRLLYKTEEGAEVLGIKDCNLECDLQDFLKVVKPFRMNGTQIEKECYAMKSI